MTPSHTQFHPRFGQPGQLKFLIIKGIGVEIDLEFALDGAELVCRVGVIV